VKLEALKNPQPKNLMSLNEVIQNLRNTYTPIEISGQILQITSASGQVLQRRPDLNSPIQSVDTIPNPPAGQEVNLQKGDVKRPPLTITSANNPGKLNLAGQNPVDISKGQGAPAIDQSRSAIPNGVTIRHRRGQQAINRPTDTDGSNGGIVSPDGIVTITSLTRGVQPGNENPKKRAS